MGLRAGTPGVIGAADGPLAHLGSVGLNHSRMSLTVGTSSALRKWVQEPSVIPGSEAWCYYLCEGNWLIGGVIHDAGNVLQWLAGNIFGESDSERIFENLDSTLESIPPGSEGLIFLPFMSGERSPFYNPSARTTLLGMAFHHGKEHVIRALIEGIAYRIHSVYTVLDEQRRMDLVLTGGILKSPAWMQITADFLGKNLYRTGVPLASAWGAVLIGLRALDVVDSMQEMNGLISLGPSVKFSPENHDLYTALRSHYDITYEKLYT
jgi:gluconokinase